MLKKRFAVIKLWPHLKAAEDECIARLKTAATKLGLECVEVDADARMLLPPRTFLTAADVDFVLSLHYEQPKRFNIFSFVALWNPTQFFHDWGYRKFTENLVTFDDFLSCSSTGADDHIRRRIAHDPTRAEPAFRLYHSLAEPMFPPTVGEGKMVYTGINWEKLGRKPGRHDELLRILDKTGHLKIFGPKIFQDVDVWEGYQSYVGPLPFDGTSIVEQIHRAGVGLVLSSAAHKQSELMSNRLFESLAAGAVIIADENPFARRFFGDTLLYLDTELPAADVAAQVDHHLHWIRSNPRSALEMAEQAQAIFARDFTLCGSLRQIYDGLEDRKRYIASLYAPPANSGAVTLLLLLPDFEPAALERHIESVATQQSVILDPVLCVSPTDRALFGDRIAVAIRRSPVPIEVRECEFYKVSKSGRTRRPLGRVLWEVLRDRPSREFLCIAGPNESLFADHISALQSATERIDPLTKRPPDGAYSSMVRYADQENGERHTSIDLYLDWAKAAPEQPLGVGRFLFRSASLEPSLGSVLPHTDALAIHVLAASRVVAASGRSSLLHDVKHPFNIAFLDAKHAQEREIVSDYVRVWPAGEIGVGGNPVVANAISSDALEQAFEQLPDEAKVRMAVRLAHSIPIPKFLSRALFGIYRFWLHRVRRTGLDSSTSS